MSSYLKTSSSVAVCSVVALTESRPHSEDLLHRIFTIADALAIVSSLPVSPYLLNLGGENNQKNSAKHGVSDAPPPKFRG